MNQKSLNKKPKIALVIGDPAGVGPELISKLLAEPDTRAMADIVLIGSQAVMGPSYDMHQWQGVSATGFERGVAGAHNGSFMIAMLQEGLKLIEHGQADALCFAPLNKGALRAGGMTHEDELRWFAEQLAHKGTCGELNVLENLWTSRVTSHIALKDVSQHVTSEGVARAIQMIHAALKKSGKTEPRIAVCGLNPHNGDGGNYGREEIDVIAPGIEMAKAGGIHADGPFPADTIFVRARSGAYDGIVTMYHDQGQIAMKLMGFEKGVTVQGGLPVIVTTPAHGTAYDIAGQGIANVGAMRNAFHLACAMTGQ
jgi:4-hydroxy-L-threonine phosphate dehydrogenase PdxA